MTGYMSGAAPLNDRMIKQLRALAHDVAFYDARTLAALRRRGLVTDRPTTLTDAGRAEVAKLEAK